MKKFRLTYASRCTIRRYLDNLNISSGKFFEIKSAQVVKANVVVSITIITIDLKEKDIVSNVLDVSVPIKRRKLLRLVRDWIRNVKNRAIPSLASD